MYFISLLGPFQYDGRSCTAQACLAQAGLEGFSGMHVGTVPSSALFGSFGASEVNSSIPKSLSLIN